VPKNHGPTWAGRDSMGNIFILPRQFEVGLCQNCRRLFGVGSSSSSSSHQQVVSLLIASQNKKITTLKGS